MLSNYDAMLRRRFGRLKSWWLQGFSDSVARRGESAAQESQRRLRVETRIGKTTLVLLRGDITQQDTEAIVNAANSTLLGGGGVDGAIHRAGGPSILAECRDLGGCATGEVKATGAGQLPAKHVLHAVGPVWRGGDSGEPGHLASCHTRAIELAESL